MMTNNVHKISFSLWYVCVWMAAQLLNGTELRALFHYQLTL